MDSPFNRPYSLYEQMRIYGGTPDSWLGSPTVAPQHSLSQPNLQQPNPQQPAGQTPNKPKGWSAAGSTTSLHAEKPSDPNEVLSKFNAFEGYSSQQAQQAQQSQYAYAQQYGQYYGQQYPYYGQYQQYYQYPPSQNGQSGLNGQAGLNSLGSLGSQTSLGNYGSSLVSNLGGNLGGNLANLSGSNLNGSNLGLGSLSQNGSLGSSQLGPQNGLGSQNVVKTPPGLAPEKVDPDEMLWCYIDLQGMEQGPFSGTQMNEWIAYLMDETQLRRASDQFYVSFAALTEHDAHPFVMERTQQEWDQVLRDAGEKTEQQHQQAQEQLPAQSLVSSQIPVKPKQKQKPKQEDIELTPRKSSGAPGDIAALKLDDEKPIEEDSARATVAEVAAHEGEHADAGVATSITQSEAHPDNQLAAKATKKVPVKVQLRAEPARAPATDPWKKSARPSAQISIAELKQQELEKQQQLLLQKKKAPAESSPMANRKGSTGRWLPIEDIQEIASGAAPELQSACPAPTWSKKVVPQARSLEDIQKEQACMSAENMQADSTNPTTTVPPVQVSTTAVAARNKNRFLALDVDQADEEPSRTVQPRQTQRSRMQGQSQSVQQQFTSVTQAASSAKPTDELIHWARVSFQDLANGIDQMELLEVFLSLPNSPSAKEFIAESVYGYSRTLDGRRFASDFLSRKKTAEQSMGPNETWKDVLKRFNPNVQEQDPSFKVVTKKRQQKISRLDMRV